ncbi:serine hydrolase domain-containing protein [Aneurinibacillus terranovensis]|uniref:serine hydrolase domain-containing protein n=1 Tax=Aneurinibacillus terranovensis TaxID=278991 RepID=UPI0004079792|nr:serine hydrolase domain-containing protein [Aneurinibacillus terranovensis]
MNGYRTLPPYPVPDKPTDFDKKMLEVMERHRVVGLAAAFVKKGSLRWTKGYGWANLAECRRVDSETIFRVASISKTVTATALMQQYEQGKLDLDDDITEYLGFAVRNPRYPDIPITCKQIMTHTSSLQDEYLSFALASRTSCPPSLKEFLIPAGRYYSDKVWGRYRPGSGHFEYSNTGSFILATIVEKLSGQRFDVYCRNHIFQPLTMRDTSFNTQDFPHREKIAVLYTYDEENDAFAAAMDDFKSVRPDTVEYSRYMPGTNGSIFQPQGGLRTNVADLSKFLLAFMGDGCNGGGRILEKETLEFMRREHLPKGKSGGFFKKSGLQLNITDELIPRKRMIGHSGDAYGCLTGMYFIPEEEDGVIFFMNGMRQRKERGKFFAVEEDIVRCIYNEGLGSSE